ncbi:phage portal protein [Endozoicomonas euniceicola]|uniref:Phage portal protein n=1 Tax=Endozoicomonas euniceicola TaxID=1234143 RepID=A0ABY6GQC6_9GAMM|nr:phage portal protein [Endozoicomonas euniceicola]UYM14266.1 phage portal protein [Endozoicomonas euniceicola]
MPWNLFKRSVSVEAPTKKKSRRFINHALVKSLFDGAKTDRLRADWPSFPIDGCAIIRRNQRILVARSREQAANNDYARSFLRGVKNNVVGAAGVKLQARAMDANKTLDTMANDAIESAWREWSKRENCDVAGRMSWPELEKLLVTTAAKDGELLLVMMEGAEAGPWGFSLQVIDPQYLPVDYDRDNMADGHYIRHGVEMNQYGRPVAYHLETHENNTRAYLWGSTRYIRIPAENVIHGFVSDFIGQYRGLPWMATALWRMKNLNEFEDSALTNARTGANKLGFLESESGDEFDPDEEELELNTESGEFTVLPPGIKPPTSWDPGYPAGEFEKFSQHALKGIAAGLGMAYHNLASDLTGVNYSSGRLGALEEREFWKDMQAWLIECLHQRVYERWLNRALLTGRIVTETGRPLPAHKINKFLNVHWQPRRWDWVDPQKDMNAAAGAMDKLLKSPGEIIRSQGRDPDEVWREYARDIDAMRKAGIPEDKINLFLQGKANASSQPANNPAADKDAE